MSESLRLARRLITLVVGIGTVVAIVIFLWSRREELVQLINVPADQLVLVILLFAIGHWINSLEFWVLYRRLGATIGASENWLLFTAGQLLNHLPGRVGTLYRFEYLRSLHAMTYPRSLSVYGTNLVITALASSALGLIGTVLVDNTSDGRSLPLLAVFGSLLVGAIIALLVPLPFGGSEGVIGRTWAAFRSGWSEITSAPTSAVQVAMLEGARYTVAAWRMQVTFSWIGLEGPWSFFLVLASVTGVVSFVALTPAAIGLRELAIGAAAAVLGSTFDQSLLGATIERAVLLLVTVIFGGVGLLVTMRRLGIHRVSRISSYSNDEI